MHCRETLSSQVALTIPATLALAERDLYSTCVRWCAAQGWQELLLLFKWPTSTASLQCDAVCSLMERGMGAASRNLIS